MNFSPFGNPFSASISGIHQFAAGAQVSIHIQIGLQSFIYNQFLYNAFFFVCVRRIHRIVIITIVLHQQILQI